MVAEDAVASVVALSRIAIRVHVDSRISQVFRVERRLKAFRGRAHLREECGDARSKLLAFADKTFAHEVQPGYR